MGENKHIEELDAFAKKYINEIESESPSIDFTKNIMDSIQEFEKSEIYKADPLISKKTWSLLIGTLVVSILYVAKGKSIGSIGFSKINLDVFSKIKIPNLFESISVSNIMLYACFFFTVLIFAQIYFLKKRFETNIKS